MGDSTYWRAPVVISGIVATIAIMILELLSAEALAMAAISSTSVLSQENAVAASRSLMTYRMGFKGDAFSAKEALDRIAPLAVDLGAQHFDGAGADGRGRVDLKPRLERRENWLACWGRSCS